MICYQDKTFCSFYMICKHGHTCDRALTPDVIDKARKWWGGDAPIAVYDEFPDCFVRWFER